MVNGKIKVYNLFMTLYFFFLFFYVFNISFINRFSNPAFITLFMIISASFFLFIANYKYLNKNRMKLLFYLILVFILITVKNGDIAHSIVTPYIYMVFMLFSIYMLSLSDRWHRIAIKIFNIFVFEHIIASILCYLFPAFYYSKILPLFPNTSRELIYQFNHLQIAGVTQHYSTNALYLVSGLLLNTSLLINDSNKSKKRVVFVLLNMIALLLTGKRSQVVTFIISMLVILFIKYKSSFIRLITKILSIFILGSIFVISISFFVPSITNSFVRVYDAISDPNVMNSRNVLYDLAVDEFKQHKLFGIGWNNYKYVYNQRISYNLREMDYMSVHNIYLQTLCEIGIVGSIIIYIIFLKLLIKSIKDSSKINDITKRKYVYIFIAFHVFFLLEGILGNSLYDIQTYTPYSIFLSMYLYYHFENNKAKVK